MYVPPLHEERDVSALQALIDAHPLGTWVTLVEGELTVNHVPFLLHRAQGEQGALVGHVARANGLWMSLRSPTECIVVFHGPQCYISPSWYPSKHAHGKAVPTWNYAVVHAHGLARAIDDRDWLLAHVSELTATHEAHQAHRWKVSDAPADYIDRMLQGIVGIEISISRLVGKWKVSQNRTDADKLGVVAGLTERSDDLAREMAAFVQQQVTGPHRS